MPYLCHSRSANLALHLLAAAMLLGQFTSPAGAQSAPALDPQAPEGGGDFATREV